MRLNQYLARAGFGSRRTCEELIRDGAVTINGHRLVELAVRVKPEDNVLVNGKPVKQPMTLVAALHKPAGYLCTSSESTRDRTVFDLLPKGWPRVVYVGRLDKESEGLLLLTNDGELAQRLTHPSSKLPKTYIVTLDREFDFAHGPKLLQGMVLEEGYGKMEEVFRVGPHTLKVVLTQGLKRQIRNMFFRLGYEVTRLVRVAVGGLSLEGLAIGQIRVLTRAEVDQSLSTFRLRSPRPNPRPRTTIGKQAALEKVKRPLTVTARSARFHERSDRPEGLESPRKYKPTAAAARRVASSPRPAGSHFPRQNPDLKRSSPPPRKRP